MARNDKPMANLTATALAARRAGMSYGNYVALHGVINLTEPIVVDEPMKVCPECRKKFPAKSRRPDAVYCSIDCQEEASRKSTLDAYYRRKKAMEEDNGQ